MLFRVYSRFVPNLTRRDGSAMDRLLSQHMDMASINQVAAERKLLPGSLAVIPFSDEHDQHMAQA